MGARSDLKIWTDASRSNKVCKVTVKREIHTNKIRTATSRKGWALASEQDRRRCRPTTLCTARRRAAKARGRRGDNRSAQHARGARACYLQIPRSRSLTPLRRPSQLAVVAFDCSISPSTKQQVRASRRPQLNLTGAVDRIAHADRLYVLMDRSWVHCPVVRR